MVKKVNRKVRKTATGTTRKKLTTVRSIIRAIPITAIGVYGKVVLISLFRISSIILILSAGIWILSLPDWYKLFNYLNMSDFIELSKVWAWPLVALLALVVLRPNFPEMVKNGIEFIFPFGLGLKVMPQQEQETPPNPTESPHETEIITAAKEINEEVKSTSTSATASITQNGDSEAKPEEANVDLKENAARLVKAIEELNTLKDKEVIFERVNGIIYESQIELLELLRTYKGGLTSSKLSPYYERYRKRVPNGMDFMRYMSLLINSTYVNYDAALDLFTITPLGEEFLAYRNRNSLSTIGINSLN